PAGTVRPADGSRRACPAATGARPRRRGAGPGGSSRRTPRAQLGGPLLGAAPLPPLLLSHAAPDAVLLAVVERPPQALLDHSAPGADRLGPLDHPLQCWRVVPPGRADGEEQLRILVAAGGQIAPVVDEEGEAPGAAGCASWRHQATSVPYRSTRRPEPGHCWPPTLCGYRRPADGDAAVCRPHSGQLVRGRITGTPPGRIAGS